MAYRYRSRRSVKRLARKSKRNFLVTLIIVIFLIYATITWILPYFISGLGVVTDIIKPSQVTMSKPSQNAALAPPVLNIPFEATNTAQIDIKGYGTPNSKVKLFIDDDPKQTADVASDGTFSLSSVTLSLGTNNIYGTTQDAEGKESLPSKTLRLIYDNEKPSLIVSEPEDGKKIQGGDKKVKVQGKTEPGVKIVINDNQIIVDKDGNFSGDFSINEGDNIILIKAIDTALNINEDQRTVTYLPQETQ